MIINNNIDAMKALNYLNINNSNTNKIMEKLSSSLKINRAADDSAGLTMSVKMKSQIRGLFQDEQNIENAISMFTVAESGMAQIGEMVNRIRELSIQSANDANTDEDRQLMQKEVLQLIEGIDKIASDTEYNTRKILQGAAETTTSTIIIYDSVPAFVSKKSLENSYNLLHAPASPINVNNTNTGYGIAVQDPNDGYTISTSFTVVTATNASFKVNTNLFNRYLLEYDPNFESFLKNDLYDTNGKVASSAAAEHFIGGIAYAMNKAIEASYSNNPNVPSNLQGIYFDDPNDSNYGHVGLYFTDGSRINYGSCSWNHVNIAHHYLHLDFASGVTANINVGTHSESVTNYTYEPTTYIIQVGANKDQNISFSIPAMPANTVGSSADNTVIAKADISTQSKANDSIALCDVALNYVNDARSLMGIYISTLESIKNSTTNYNLNISAAESRLRDANMAKEVLSQLKGTILAQSATAMLAQATQKPREILQLLL